MSIAEIIPTVRALPRSEKFRLVRLLLDDLAEEELLSGIKQGQEFPIYTPEFAPASAALLKEQEKSQPRFASALEFLESLPPGPRAFPTWEEYERHLREEKDSWDR